MKTAVISFTERGYALALRRAEALGGTAERLSPPPSLAEWTKAAFERADAIVFVGAAGIAVRAIAPYVRSKDKDPAVVVVDEAGRFAIPVLSGHLGGANDLARRISALIGAIPVITTATDVNGVFAVDEWAKRQNCVVAEVPRIKTISGPLLARKTVRFFSRWEIAGEVPAGIELSGPEDCDAALTVWQEAEDALHLVPRILVLGIGCRKGTPASAIEEAVRRVLAENRLRPEAVAKICSIDLKAEEEGLIACAADFGVPFETFTAAELEAVPGDFTPSAFVSSVTGVDNVCERSAVLGSGGRLIVKKTAGGGVTVAAALMPYAPDWHWREE